jgi:DNA-binding NarL/FixJ family response regulator
MATHLQLVPQLAEGDSDSVSREPVRVLLAEDHLVLRCTLRQVLDLELDIEVVAEVDDLVSMIDQLYLEKPDVLVLGLRRPVGLNRETICNLRDAQPTVRIIVLTMGDQFLIRRLLSDGADAVVRTDHADVELPLAIQRGSAPLVALPQAGLEPLRNTKTFS